MRDGLPPNLSPSTGRFVEMLTAVFGAPETGNASEFKRILNDRVGGYETPVMERAAGHFIETRKSWPKIADVIAVARAEDMRREVESRPERPAARDPWSPEAESLADGFMDSELGRRAAVEGWIGSLWDFCRIHARLPHEGLELNRLLDKAREHHRKAKLVRGGEIAGEIGKSLQRLMAELDRKDQRLCALAGGRE